MRAPVYIYGMCVSLCLCACVACPRSTTLANSFGSALHLVLFSTVSCTQLSSSPRASLLTGSSSLVMTRTAGNWSWHLAVSLLVNVLLFMAAFGVLLLDQGLQYSELLPVRTRLRLKNSKLNTKFNKHTFPFPNIHTLNHPKPELTLYPKHQNYTYDLENAETLRNSKDFKRTNESSCTSNSIGIVKFPNKPH